MHQKLPIAVVAFLLQPFTALSAPSQNPEVNHPIISLFSREPDTWQKCEKTGQGFCTIYVASSDNVAVRPGAWNNYRNAVILDNKCVASQGVRTDVFNPKITLKGHLPAYVDLYVSSYYRPTGKISYLGRETHFGDAIGNMACHKFADTDGVACRIAFDCS